MEREQSAIAISRKYTTIPREATKGLGLSSMEPNMLEDLDRAPLMDEKPYFPADFQIVEVTPPAFTWIPCRAASCYILEVSPFPDFPRSETRVYGDIERAAFVPRESLPAGKWFWRYGVRAGDRTEMGRPRPFIVPESARHFPFPNLGEIIPRIPTARPRLFFPAQKLASLRRMAAELYPNFEGISKWCERGLGSNLMPEPRDVPEDPGELPKWQAKLIGIMRPEMDLMEECALCYLLTEDERFGRECARRILHFFSWNTKGPTSLFAFDEPSMWMMMRGVRAYDWTYELFSPADHKAVKSVIKERALEFFQLLQQMPFENRPYESHAGRIPGLLGEVALSFIHEWPEAREWLEYVLLIFHASFPAWGEPDGSWHEGPNYWMSYIAYALHFITALRHSTGIDLLQTPFFRNTPLYITYTASPYNEHTPFGDGQQESPFELARNAYALSSLLKDPMLRWYSECAGFRPGRDTLSLSNLDPSIQARAPLDLPQTKLFPGTGLASIHTAIGDRERDITFLLRSSPAGNISHAHADQNAFAIEAFGRAMAIATGYFPYWASPHHWNWTHATRSVNSILVNGEGQTRNSREARGSIMRFEPGGGYDYVEAEAGEAYGGRLERFRRHVVHIRPGIFIIFDDVVATEPSTFQWLLHTCEEVRINRERSILEVTRESVGMNVHILLPHELEISQTDRYDPEPEMGEFRNTWHVTVSTRKPNLAARFLTIFAPHRIDRKKDLPVVALGEAEGALAVTLIFFDGSRETVGFRTSGSFHEISCEGLTSDGLVFGRGLNSEGQVSRILCIDGSRVTENEEILKVTNPGNFEAI